MPVMSISTERLNKLIGRELSPFELIDYLEQIGCDVEDYTKIHLHRCPRCQGLVERLTHEDHPRICDNCGYQSDTPFLETRAEEVIRLELLPDRPDLFDVGGLARALRGYLNLESGLPNYDVRESGVRVIVEEHLSQPESYRPYIATAVIRGLLMDSETVKGVMKQQENLHWALGRDRKKASIGVYDLETIQPDIYYKAIGPEEIKFTPLGMPGEDLTPREILEKHPKGMAYAHLLEDLQMYPLLIDSKGQVLSMPPIINSEETKVTERTRDLFIDVTGLSPEIVMRCLNILVTSLAEMGGRIESVEVLFPDNKTLKTPDLSPITMNLSPERTSKLIGVELSREELIECLRRMRLDVEDEGRELKVYSPAYRTDIKHEVDLIEDVAIAYGYHKIKPTLVPTMTVGQEREVERFSGMVRQTMIGLGFQEIMTLMLTNPEDHYRKLRMDVPLAYVEIKNPASYIQRIVRTHLLSGILDTFRINKTKDMPQRLFEIGDVSTLDKETETRTRDERRLVFGVMGPKTGYAEIRSYAQALFRELNLEVDFEPFEHPTFIEGRCASIFARDKGVGFMGEVHPEVLENFGLLQAVVLSEVNLSLIIEDP